MKTLQTLAVIITDGWAVQSCCSQTLPYRQMKDNLSKEDGMIYKGEHVVIPTTLHPMVKEKIHAAHLGYDNMMQRVCTIVFWSSIQHEVQQLAEKCETCQKPKQQNQKEQLIPHDVGSSPWQEIGADHAEIFEID